MSLPDTLNNIASSRAATLELYLLHDIVSVNMYGILLAYVPCTMYQVYTCLLYTSPSPRDLSTSRMPSSA